jgi:hypothetical protein
MIKSKLSGSGSKKLQVCGSREVKDPDKSTSIGITEEDYREHRGKESFSPSHCCSLK